MILELKQRNVDMILSTIPLRRPRGEIIEIAFNTEFTHFNIQDFVKQSKKTRSNKVEYAEKQILLYSMVGKCIHYRNRGSHTTFTIRNVVDLTSYELTYFIFSPLLKYYGIRQTQHNIIKHPYKRATAYFLRHHPPVESATPFDYVLDYNYSEND
jgi:ribosomal protein L19